MLSSLLKVQKKQSITAGGSGIQSTDKSQQVMNEQPKQNAKETIKQVVKILEDPTNRKKNRKLFKSNTNLKKIFIQWKQVIYFLLIFKYSC